MRQFLLLSLLLSTPVLAQQVDDPQVVIYRQLLDNANAQMARSLAAMQTQVNQLQKELAEEKAKAKPSDGK